MRDYSFLLSFRSSKKDCLNKMKNKILQKKKKRNNDIFIILDSFPFPPLFFGAGELWGLPLLFGWYHYPHHFVFVCTNTVITSKVTYIGTWLGPSTTWPWGEEKLTCCPSHLISSNPKSQSYWTSIVRYHVFSDVSIRWRPPT